MSDYVSRIISAIEHEVRKHGYDLILKISKNEDDQDRCLEALAAIGISVIVLFPWGNRTCSDQLLRLKMEKVPCVRLQFRSCRQPMRQTAIIP